MIAATMLTMALVPGVAAASNQPAGSSQAGAVDPDTVLVRMDTGPPGRLLRSGSEWVSVEVRDGETPEEAIERLEDDPVVAEASFNYRYEQLDVDPPDDPFYPFQWHLPDVGILGAWEHTRGAGATIAVIDGGVSNGGDDLVNPLDLGCRDVFVDAYNAATETAGSAEPEADDPHGTHVAGVAAQCSDNGVGTAGMAPEANLMPIRAADSSDRILTSYVKTGIEWAVDRGADVINISLGLDCNDSLPPDGHWPDCSDPAVDEALAYAAAAGVPVIVASGNDSHTEYVSYPANHPETIAVGASTVAPTVADYSNGGFALDLVAPGGDTDGWIWQESFDKDTGIWDTYGRSGTSFAAPHVAGAVALLRSLDSSLTPDEVLDVLTGSALDIEDPGRDDASGAGLLQADAAIDRLLAPPESDSSVIGGPGVVSEAVVDQIESITGTEPTRLSGSNRFATASAVSEAVSEAGEPVVYVATGQNFPDALAVGPVAALQGAPVLLVNRDSIPSATRAELKRLQPHRIVVLGGPAAVSTGVELQLWLQYADVVDRLAGANRYTTAVEISKSFFRNAPRVDTVYLTTGQNFPDALSAGPAATVGEAPVLLTAANALPSSVANEIVRLDPERVVIVGGTGAVSNGVAQAVQALEIRLSHDLTIDRMAGSNRYATSALVVGDAFGDTPVPTYVATGENFPDALAAGAAIGSRDGALLLTRTNSVPGVIAAELARLSS